MNGPGPMDVNPSEPSSTRRYVSVDREDTI